MVWNFIVRCITAVINGDAGKGISKACDVANTWGFMRGVWVGACTTKDAPKVIVPHMPGGYHVEKDMKEKRKEKEAAAAAKS